ncbi:hypothetical protein I316_05666 [Kwoniella heveanensis BCC8398]|uniref:Helicase C-terminal domain-containing protein n=1 Tax=Kwoniella heveanensis BCC8398 TaxID=1296120 RepID=A0A1B9GPK4_9TREE|nr:hypothetical protein I316_05666 [Kwoniella heveanensis BCC8398]
MVQMETQPRRLVDPLFTRFTEAGRETTYYINLRNWDIQRNPGWYDLPRGGILCEQMGTGKTLMCLSLITSSLHQPTLPSSNSIDLSPVTTDVAERTYPFAANAALRQMTGFPKAKTQLALPSLVDLTANLLAIHDPSARHTLSLPPAITDILHRKTFYCPLPADDHCARAARRRSTTNTVNKVFLAKGTLLVVPAILLEQWKSEMAEHLEVGALNVLTVAGSLPGIETLLDFDLILRNSSAHLGFAMEETEYRRNKGLPPSVLLQARWKRIILDEGHVAASKTTNAMAFSRQLNVERRWLVSGTPTRHLQQGGETEMETLEDSTAPAMGSSSAAQSHNEHVTPLPEALLRQWSSKELEDATRIGQMVGGFLAAEPYKSDMGFQQHVTAELRGPEGPSIGSVRRLKDIMAGVIVKHGPKEIDHEATLPPSTITTTVLQFDPMQRITYNVLAALVASNVYTSGGEDIDYFLHQNNRDTFLRVISNLNLACFWYSASEIGAEDGLRRTRYWLETHPNANQHAREQLEEACKHLEAALQTPGWNQWMKEGVSMPMDGSELPEAIQAAWSDSASERPDMVDVYSLLTIREANKAGTTLDQLEEQGRLHREQKQLDVKRELDQHEGRRSKGKGRKTKDNGWSAANAPQAAPKTSRKLTSNEKRKRPQDEIEQRLEEAERNALVSTIATMPGNSRTDDESGPRPLPTFIHTRSRSAKANFVAKLVLDAPEGDKFVIFGDVYELGHLTELLDLLDITSTYVGGHSIDRRTALESFQKPEIKVCLLDLRTGARGLNLVVANCVIFLQPIWSPDVQAQAIKRVHRIGQTRPTQIHILVTEGTFEEEIAQRSLKNRSDDAEKLYSRNMIENPRFVYAEKQQTDSFAVRFVPKGELLRSVDDVVMTPTAPTAAPSASSSLTSTPTETSLLTPTDRGGSSLEQRMFASPSRYNREKMGDMMASAADAEDGKDGDGKTKKKRVRVTFV